MKSGAEGRKTTLQNAPVLKKINHNFLCCPPFFGQMSSFSEHAWHGARRHLANSTFLPQPMPRHLTSMHGHRTPDTGPARVGASRAGSRPASGGLCPRQTARAARLRPPSAGALLAVARRGRRTSLPPASAHGHPAAARVASLCARGVPNAPNACAPAGTGMPVAGICRSRPAPALK